MNPNTPAPEIDEMSSAMSLGAFTALLLASGAGALAATLVLPAWLPGISASLEGSVPQAFWFLSRASALVAYLLVWLSMCLGLLITNKLARLWPGGPLAFDLHQHTSLLGVAFALFHGLILLGDQYLKISLWQLTVPFTVSGYRPAWVGLGQVGFYLLAIVAFSFYVRKQLTPRRWRLVHFASFAAFALALLHGIASGSDTTTPWALALYWSTSGVFVFLLVYRVLVSAFKPAPAHQAGAH